MSQQGSRGVWQVGALLMNNSVMLINGSGAPSSSTFAGRAGPGSQYTDIATGLIYYNTGSKATPSWVQVNGGVLHVQISLTAAQIITLFSAPVALVAAPGAGNYLAVHNVAMSMTYGSVQFTGGGVVSVVDHGTHNAVHTATGITAATVQAAASFQLQLGGNSANGGLTRPIVTGINIEAATADFAAGDSTANVDLWYSVVKA